MNTLKLRNLYESRIKETNGRWRFLTEMRNGLGLCDKDGNDNRDFAGNLALKERSLRPEQFSLQELAESVIGPSCAVCSIQIAEQWESTPSPAR